MQTRKLEGLNLSKNILTGHLTQLLGSDSPSLDHLFLQDCQLSEADINSLAPVVQNRRLETLDLSKNILTGHLTQLLGSDPPSLCHLSLEDCHLNGADISSLAPVVQDRKLEGLNLSKNILTGHLTQLLGSDSPSLDLLYLCDCQLSEADINSLVPVVETRKLEWLNLSKNILTGHMAKLLGSDPPSLCHLSLKDCHLNGADISSLAPVVQDRKLETLDLSKNILTGHLTQLLGSDSPSLDSLYLQDCQLSEADINSLAPVVQNRRLKWLDLSKNALTGHVGKLLGPDLCSVEGLGLKGSLLNEADVANLTQIVQGTKWLERLDLSQNTLTGHMAELLAVFSLLFASWV